MAISRPASNVLLLPYLSPYSFHLARPSVSASVAAATEAAEHLHQKPADGQTGGQAIGIPFPGRAASVAGRPTNRSLGPARPRTRPVLVGQQAAATAAAAAVDRSPAAGNDAIRLMLFVVTGGAAVVIARAAGIRHRARAERSGQRGQVAHPRRSPSELLQLTTPVYWPS